MPSSQLAGIVAITDGETFDAPGSTRPPASLTTLLTARAPETDRELHLLDAPAYGLVGQTAAFKFSVLDHGAEHDGAEATVTVTADGALIATRDVVVGQPQTIGIPVSHAGATVVAAAVSPLPCAHQARRSMPIQTTSPWCHFQSISYLSPILPSST